MDELKYIDLVYHGYEWDEDSVKYQNEFRELIKKNFPEITMEDAYDSIKGYRTCVYAPESFDMDVYVSFLLAFGFSDQSFCFLCSDKDKLPSEQKIIDILRERWPEALKEEYR